MLLCQVRLNPSEVRLNQKLENTEKLEIPVWVKGTYGNYLDQAKLSFASLDLNLIFLTLDLDLIFLCVDQDLIFLG